MGTQSPSNVSTKLQRIAELASQSPQTAFTALNHYIDIELLHEAHRCTRKGGAVGVDGQTADEYAVDLEGNLRRLHDRFKSGTYQAPPVRRVRIPKGEGKRTRPIGIPTFEDKILQRAVTMVLEVIYEQDFLPCSYGFRPGLSAHMALEDLWQKLMATGGGWVLEVDIQSFFDHLDHGHLRDFLDRRVRDGVLRRAIDKWLKAGVLESGCVAHPETGTPQGGVISPLLANIYLHEVVDTWFETQIKPRLTGRASLIRYADDFVMVFTSERDARRVLAILPKRLGRYGLRLHPDKTRLIDFRRPTFPEDGKSTGKRSRPATFDLLGFTHHWGLSRRGYWVVQRKTARRRLSRSLKALNRWCRLHRHKSIAWQHAGLVRKLNGHCAYFGITGNGQRLWLYRHELLRIWLKWLSRRSQRAKLQWDAFHRIQRRYPIPAAIVVKSVFRQAANP
jgi:group II intron reverse transcriptase/maturase